MTYAVAPLSISAFTHRKQHFIWSTAMYKAVVPFHFIYLLDDLQGRNVKFTLQLPLQRIVTIENTTISDILVFTTALMSGGETRHIWFIGISTSLQELLY